LRNFLKLESAAPLFVAASNGHTKIVRYLIEKGADISAKTRSVKKRSVDECKDYSDGLTPLHGVVYKLRFGEKHLIYQERMKEESAGIIRLLLEPAKWLFRSGLRPANVPYIEMNKF